MIFNIDVLTYTAIHTGLSLIALFSGLVLVSGLLRSQRLKGWTAMFLLTAIATDVTGFGFPTPDLDPAKIVGIVSLVALGLAMLTRYMGGLTGISRWSYAISTMVSIYLLVFVTVAQLFDKVPALKAMAPTQSEPPFAMAQGAVLIVFLILTVLAMRRFHPKVGLSARHGDRPMMTITH
jgi:hypothetical protein